IVGTVRRLLPALAWRRQDRAGGGVAPRPALGLSVDDCLSRCLHRLSGLPDDVCAFGRASRAYGLRCLRGLAHLSGVPQTAVPPRSPSPARGGGSGWGPLAALSDDVVRSEAGVGRTVGGRRVVHAATENGERPMGIGKWAAQG